MSVDDFVVTLQQYGGVPNDNTKDCGAAWDSAWAAIMANGGGTLDLTPTGNEVWYTARAPRALTVAGNERGGQNAQLPIPNWEQAMTARIRWGRPARTALAEGSLGSYSPTGPAIISTLTGQTFGSGFYPSVIGGVSFAIGSAPSTSQWPGMLLVTENLHVIVPSNPTVTGCDFTGIAQLRMAGSSVVESTASAPGTSNPWGLCTSPFAQGVILPTRDNNALVEIDSLDVIGFYAGVAPNEHTHIKRLGTYFNGVALAPYGGFSHDAVIEYWSEEQNRNGIAYVDPNLGIQTSIPVSAPDKVWIHIEEWDSETHTTGNFARISCFQDSTNVLLLTGKHGRADEAAGITSDYVAPLGGTNIRLVDAHRPGAACTDTCTNAGRTGQLNPADDGGYWDALIGGWSATASGLYNQTGSSGGLCGRYCTYSDGTLGCTVAATATDWQLFFRYQSPGNFYDFVPGGATPGLYKVVGGTATLLTPVAAITYPTLTTGDRYTITFRGGDILVYHNGVLLGAYEDFTYRSGTIHGIKSNTTAAVFSNWSFAP